MKFLSKLRNRDRAPSLPPKPTFNQNSPPPCEKPVPLCPRIEQQGRPSHQDLLAFLRYEETISPSRRPSETALTSRRPSHLNVHGTDFDIVAQPGTPTPTEPAAGRHWYSPQPLKTSASSASVLQSGRSPAVSIPSPQLSSYSPSQYASSIPRYSDGSVKHLSLRDDSSSTLLASSPSSRSQSGSGSMLRDAGRRLLSISQGDNRRSQAAAAASSSSVAVRQMYGVAQRGSTTSLSNAVTANASSPNVATFDLADLEGRRGSAADSEAGASSSSDKLADQLRRKRSMPAFGKGRRSRPATSSGASGYGPPPLPLASPRTAGKSFGLISASEGSAHSFREHSTSFGGSGSHSGNYVRAWQARGADFDSATLAAHSETPTDTRASADGVRHGSGAGSTTSPSRRALPFHEQRSFHMPLRRNRPGTTGGVCLSPTQPLPPRSPTCAHVQEECAARSPDSIWRMATPGDLRSAATAPSAQTAKWAVEAADLRHTAMCKLESEVHEHVLQQLASRSEDPQTLRSLNLSGVFVEARRRLSLDPTASRYQIPDEVPTGGASVVAFGALDSSATLVNMPWLAPSSTPSSASEASPCPDTPGPSSSGGISTADVAILAPSTSGELAELPALKVSLSPAPRRRRRPQTAPEEGSRRGLRGPGGDWARNPGSFGPRQEIAVAEDLTPRGTLLGHSPTLGGFGVLAPSAFKARAQAVDDEPHLQSRQMDSKTLPRVASGSLSGPGTSASTPTAQTSSYLSDSTRASNDSCSTSATSESMLFGNPGLGVALDGKVEPTSTVPMAIAESSSESTLAVAL